MASGISRCVEGYVVGLLAQMLIVCDRMCFGSLQIQTPIAHSHLIVYMDFILVYLETISGQFLSTR